MNDQDKKTEEKPEKNPQKEKYQSPEIESEDLMAFAAVCNGAKKGGRKATAGAPDFCRSNRLNS
jgi:hypothetical protein